MNPQKLIFNLFAAAVPSVVMDDHSASGGKNRGRIGTKLSKLMSPRYRKSRSGVPVRKRKK